MDWGLANRLARILKPPHGRTVMLAVDHGYFLGPTSGLEEPDKTIAPLLPHADSLMLTRGVLRTSVPPSADIPIVLRVSGGTSVLRELSHEGLTVAIDDAIRLNVSAVTMSIFVGAEGERQSLLNLAKLVDSGRAARHPRAGGDRRRQGDDARRAVSRPLLPDRRRDRRPLREDVLLRRVRRGRARDTGPADHRGRKKTRERAGDRARPRTLCAQAPRASTWVATSFSRIARSG